VKDQEFLKKLKLVISMDGKKLYSGDLLAVSLNKAVSLGIFQPGKSGEMKFQITVPSELNNDFALRNGDVKWIFSVEEDQKEKIQPSQTPAGQSEKEENSDGYSRKTGASSGKTAPVKTGDDTGIRFFLILEGVALLAGILVLRKGGRKN
jgi:bifunctional DNA-binding transcriptional regulator/antitoxin component of YhaV-PrlF toxin-antitoxin module